MTEFYETSLQIFPSTTHLFLYATSSRVMSLDSSSAISPPVNAHHVVLTDISVHANWILYVTTLLTKQSLGHLASSCPSTEGPEADRLNIDNLPIAEPVDGTDAEIEDARTREAHRKSANKAYGIVAATVSSQLLRQFSESSLPHCAHCLMTFFTHQFHTKMEQDDTRQTLTLLDSVGSRVNHSTIYSPNTMTS